MYWVIVLCGLGAPNVGLVCIDSKPIKTLEQCEQARDSIKFSSFTRCEKRRK